MTDNLTPVTKTPTTPRPAAPECHPENIPDALKAAGKFCTWKYVWTDGADGKPGRWNKTPYNPRIGWPASTTDPKTFGDYGDIEDMLDRYDGAGILIYGHVCGIDIDNCVQADGSLTASAQTIIDEIDSYTELSPSKTGVHILFTVTDDIFQYIPNTPDEYQKKYYVNNAPKYKGRGKDGQHEEIYIPGTTTGRYLTITGDTLGPGRDLEDRTEKIIPVIMRYMRKDDPAPTPTKADTVTPVSMMSDDEILDKLFHADKNGSDFEALYNGDASAYDNDESRADQALLQKLAFYSGGRADVIERLFSSSALAEISRSHHKWGRRSYMNTSISKAISACGGNFYNPDYYRDDTRADRVEWTEEDQKGFEEWRARKRKEAADTVTPVSKNPDASTSDALSASNSNETAEGEQVQADDGKTAENAADGVTDEMKRIRPIIPYRYDHYITGGIFQTDIDYFRKYKDRKTGYKVIDKYLTLYPGVACLGGGSSMGKTTFCTCLCDNLIRQGETVLYFTLEQEPIELVTKILSRRLAEKYPDTPLTNTDIKNGATSDQLEEIKRESAEEIGDHLQIIRCDFSITADRITGAIEDYMKQHDRRPVVVIDYLQLVAAPDDFRGDARAAIDYNIKAFKMTQRNNELFMILVSSFNRSNYETPASFEDFKESGMIEYSCDYVWELQVSNMESNDFYYTKGAKGGIRETTKKEKSNMINSALKLKQRPVEFVSLKSRNGRQRYEAFFRYDVEHDYFVPESGVLYAKNPEIVSKEFEKLYPKDPGQPVTKTEKTETKEGFQNMDSRYNVPIT